MSRKVYQRAFASARLSGERLDPLDVTRALVIPPDRQHRAGEPRLSRTKSGGVRRYDDYNQGMWSISSRRFVDSPRLEVHLDWLLKQFEERRSEIAELTRGDVIADFFCFSEGATDQPPSLPRAIRERSEALGMEIIIDHYDSSDD